MQKTQKDFQTTWAKIVAKAWSDPEFKARLVNDPEDVLTSHGIEIPSGMHVEVNECTKDTFYLILPEKPSSELMEKQLESIAAGHSGIYSNHIG